MAKEVISDWQDGHTLPQFPGLYQRQFSVVPGTLFKPKDDDRNYHYFDGEKWYVYGWSKENAMFEYRKRNADEAGKYLHAPWRGVIGEAK